MVSSNTSEERAERGYRTRDNGVKREFEARNSGERNYKGNDGFKKEFKADSNKFERRKDYNSNDGERRNNRFNREGQRDNNHGGEFKKNYGNSNKGNSQREHTKGNADRMSGSADSKVKEQQPDKMDIVRRLEKEKKAIQKKNDNYNKGSKSANARPQKRIKRTNNIDWTREYENDSYDDDDAYFMY